MNDQKAFIEYKALIEKQIKKDKRVTSITLGLAAMVAVMFMVYGFTQSIESNRQRIEGEKMTQMKDTEIASLQSKLKECEDGKK